MLPMTAGEIAAAVGGSLIGCGSAQGMTATSVSRDNREVEPGALFVALRGEKNDGHAYVDAALEAGAAGCLVQEAPGRLFHGKFYIRVADTRLALKALAAHYRNKFDIPVVGVTGSVGKTTTKDMIASVLESRFCTLKTQGNFNNDIGVPLTLFRLMPEHEAAVIEMGMNHEGEIRYLTEMVRPTLGVITNVGDAHIEFLGSREGILAAKSELFEGLATHGAAVLNGDDEMLLRLEAQLTCPITWCGESEQAQWRVSEVRSDGGDGTLCHMEGPGFSGEVSIPAPGRHMLYPASTAMAVGAMLGLTGEELVRGVANYCPTGQRMNLKYLQDNILLLADAYNANPQSMRAGLEVLAAREGGPKIAVLGDMGELGDLSREAHRNVGRAAGELGIDLVLTVGERARELSAAAKEAGVAQTIHCADKKEALLQLERAVVPGAVLLVKASHFMGFSELVEELCRRWAPEA